MKKIILLFFISLSQVSLAESEFGFNPKTSGLTGYGSYGFSPEQKTYYEQLNQDQIATYRKALQLQIKRDAQLKKADAKFQDQLKQLADNYQWETKTSDCKSRMQALVKSASGNNSKEFILKKDQLVFVDGAKTSIYSDNGLTVVSDLKCCEHNRSAKISDGMAAVFNSTLPKVNPPKGQLSQQDESILNEQFKSHLATLKACKELFSEDYVSTTIKMWHMQNGNASAPPSVDVITAPIGEHR